MFFTRSARINQINQISKTSSFHNSVDDSYGASCSLLTPCLVPIAVKNISELLLLVAAFYISFSKVLFTLLYVLVFVASACRGSIDRLVAPSGAAMGTMGLFQDKTSTRVVRRSMHLAREDAEGR